MDSFLLTFPSDSFHINTRTFACIFSSLIIICLLVFLFLNTSATSPPHLLTPFKGNTHKVPLIFLSPLFKNSYSFVLMLVQCSKRNPGQREIYITFSNYIYLVQTIILFTSFPNHFDTRSKMFYSSIL